MVLLLQLLHAQVHFLFSRDDVHHLFPFVEDYDVDVRNIRNGVVDIRNNVVVKCCK